MSHDAPVPPSDQAPMRALRMAAIDRMEVAELPRPHVGPGDVEIEVEATGICGSDLHGFTGENGRRFPGQVMGHESAGRVSRVGDGVVGLSPGDHVTFNPVVIPEADLAPFAGREQMSPNRTVIGVHPDVVAAFAQFLVVPARNVVPLPPELPLEHGALIEPLAVAVHAVRRAGVRPGDAVLVVGGGPIGQSVVLALQMAGVERVVVTETIASRRELVTTLGATALDAADPDVPDAVRSALGGPADAAVDAVGIEATVALSLAVTRLGGTVCLVGMGARRLTLDAFAVSTEERTLTGSFTYSAQDFRDAAAWIATQPERAAALISRVVPIEAGHEEFTHLAGGGDTPGKVLVRLRG